MRKLLGPLVLAVVLSSVPSVPALAQSAVAAAVTITSPALRVEVDSAFPRIVSYVDVASGAVLNGNEDTLTQVVLNGVTHTPTVTSTVAPDRVDYVLTFAQLGGVTVNATIAVTGGQVEFRVTKIADTSTNKINTIAIPGHNLVSVRSNQAGAAIAAARMHTATTGTGDTFGTLTASTAVDSAPVGYMYAVVNTGQLAAAIATNSYYDNPSGATANENARITKQTVDKGSYKRLGIWSGDWLYRSAGAAFTDTEPLPSAKIVITRDRNADSAVDWQDGAIAFRDVMTNPVGWQKVAKRPVMRIPFNFASNAAHPFDQTLDETKRVALNTDGLGQFVLLKGYGSEGHDSAHPDYADVGHRQGGAADLNALISGSDALNADIGVHLQATEAYPVAQNFDPAILKSPLQNGWDWLDQSYYIDTRKDGQSGKRLARLQEFKNKVPGLDFLYVDVWYGDGYVTRKFAREMTGLGYEITTEFPSKFEENATWTHWANDINYGGTDTKGINSQLVRFIRNHQRDNWIAGHPLLGGGDLAAYEGWQGRTDYPAFLNRTFGIDLPTKYLQGSPITKWTSAGITLANGVSVATVGGARQISKDGHPVLTGGSYLLPWDQQAETKLYHWNSAAATTNWTLPTSWGSPSSVKLYRLGDTGRTFVSDLAVSNRQVSITAAANTPYVVYRTDPGAAADPNWGAGTPLKDPNFYAGDLTKWTVSGDVGKASVGTTTTGQKQLRLASGGATTVSQQLTGLTGGTTYAASAYVQTASGRKATLGVTPTGGTASSVWTTSSPYVNNAGADEHNSTTMQRMKTHFTVPSGQTTATLALAAEAGTATVVFDSVRVVANNRTAQGTHHFVEDFENVDTGWGPFVTGDAGGSKTDPRTHLAQPHAPYTQAGWNGKLIDDVIAGGNSLKSHEERAGLIYRTLPQTLRFNPGRRYSVSFSYEVTNSGEYTFVSGTGTTVQNSTGFTVARTPTRFTATVDGSAAGDTFIGVRKTSLGADTNGEQHDLVIDDLVVDDIGPAAGGSTVRLPQSQLSVKYVDSQETSGENGAAVNVLDGSTSTIWHTKWSGGSDPMPHELQLDLGKRHSTQCLYLTPRQSQSNGRIAGYEVYTSLDGTTWGTAAATGTWTDTIAEQSACFTPRAARYLRLRVLSEVGGNPWASAAEINVGVEARLPKAGMTVRSVDSADTATGGGGANVLDGDPATLWHTAWSQVDPDTPMPHELQLDLGAAYSVTCLHYLPRSDGANGRIAGYEVHTSTDGSTWSAGGTGTWVNSADEQQACFGARQARYVRLRSTSEVNGGPWTSVAELAVSGS